MKPFHYLLLGLAILTGFGAVLLAQVFRPPYRYQGSLLDPPVSATDFTLTDQHGQAFRLSDQRGRAVLLFFGYTHCPDVCPVTLSLFKQVRARLGPAAASARFVYITVDPERDTPAAVGAYVSNFDPAIIGLTGSRAQLEPIWQAYGVYQARVEAGSAAGYLVDHSAYVYAIDPNGDLRLTYAFGSDGEALWQDLSHLLAEKPANSARAAQPETD
jgi:protein SCO1/2